MSKINVIITGSTGMIGKACLLESIDSPDVEAILLVNRSPIDVKHPKVIEVLVKDFFNLDNVREDLRGYNTCFFCLGMTSAGMNEVDYTHIMYDLPVTFARQLLGLNPDMTFCFVSGAGTDSTEKGRTMWARVKGRAENEILKLGFKNAYMFRPGFIQPKRGIRSRTGLYNILYTALGPLYFILKRIPKFVSDTNTLAKAMIRVALDGYSKNILESEDINVVGRK